MSASLRGKYFSRLRRFVRDVGRGVQNSGGGQYRRLLIFVKNLESNLEFVAGRARTRISGRIRGGLRFARRAVQRLDVG